MGGWLKTFQKATMFLQGTIALPPKCSFFGGSTVTRLTLVRLHAGLEKSLVQWIIIDNQIVIVTVSELRCVIYECKHWSGCHCSAGLCATIMNHTEKLVFSFSWLHY